MDQGSDNMAAVHFGQRVLGLNLGGLHDGSHGAWNDCKRMSREGNLTRFFYLFFIVLNTPHGPFPEDSRWNGLQEAWGECSRIFSAKQCVLFSEFCKDISAEAGSTGALDNDQDISQMFKALEHDVVLQNKSYKVNLNRFFHAIERRRFFATHWTKRL